MDPVSRSIVADAIRRIEIAANTASDPTLIDYLGRIANDLQAALDRTATPTPGR